MPTGQETSASEWIEVRYYIGVVDGWYCVIERATGKVVSVMDRVP